MLIPRVLFAATLAAFPTMLSAQVANAPCFEPNYGTLLGTGDDVVFPTVALGFPFTYGGSTWTDIEISSNGFVWLGANANFDPRCCAGTGVAFVADPASIAVLWTDLVADGGGGVYFNALPGRAVITWANIREYGANSYFTLQMQLTALNEVTFWYGPGTTIASLGHSAVAGITPGANAANPGSIDLSATFPINTNTDPTLYEEWPVGTFDMAARTWEIISNGSTGWIALDRPGCQFVQGSFTAYGTGCPGQFGNPYAEFYELFQPASSFDLTGYEMIPIGSQGYLVQPTTATWFSGFSNATNLADDQTIPVALPFTFPTPAGSVTSVGLCSNGYLHLSNDLSAGYFPSSADFTGGSPRIFGAMSDWYRPGAGQIWSDQVNATTWAFTWDGVAEFANSTPAGTWQMQIEASGRVVLLFQSMSFSSGRDMLTGFSRGNGVLDPGSTDISTAMPFATGTGLQPLVLSQNSGNPVVGTTYNLRISQQPTSAVGAFMMLGFGQTAIPLDSIGMTGCVQHMTLDAAWFVPVARPDTIVGLNLPNRAIFIGYTLYAQAAELAPGVNPLGVAASNGGQFTIGTF